MKGAWIKGSILERAAVRLRHRVRPHNGEALDIFAELRKAAKIIIFPNDRVGGLFLGAPAYKAVREHYPGTAIHLFADPGKAELARQIPFVDEVVTADPTQPAWSAAFSQITASLRRQEFDLALCLGADCSFRRAQICGASGARLRVGFKREGIAPFNIEIIPRPGAGVYEGDQYFSMLRLLGLGGGGEVRWRIAEDQARQVRCRYLHGEFARADIIGIDLTGGEGQGLTSRQLYDIVGRVVERGARAVLFFGLAQTKEVTYLKETYGNRILAFDQQDLAGGAALLEGCVALISCNTDLLHLAISLQVPVIGIFDEDPLRWISPRNELVSAVRATDIRGVSISQIAQELDEVLSRDAASVRG